MFEPYDNIYELACPFLNIRDNDIHTRVAYSFAQQLLREEGGDEAVVLPAIILHDVGWKSIPEELHLKAFGPGQNDAVLNRVHEVEGAKLARQLLEKAHYDQHLIEDIVTIIEAHDSRRDPLSLNDAIVKDSDKLWRLSKEALEIDPKRFNIRPEVHTKWLGLQIDHWFLTKSGRRIAKEEYRQRAVSFGLSD
jgi:HD superfamily phosphodiesterase